MMKTPDPRANEKHEAALVAVGMIEDGMAVGLGTGSTAAFAIEALALRVREGLRVRAIPTSERTAAQARAGGIPLVGFAECRWLDLAIDGADEVARGSLDLMKGLGGALLREKIVAAAADRLVIIADETKLVDRLGERAPVPVEVAAFGWEATEARLAALGVRPSIRRGADGTPFHTDGGNVILDCAVGPIDDAAAMQRALKGVVGVVETGLFIGMADCAIIGGSAVLRRGALP